LVTAGVNPAYWRKRGEDDVLTAGKVHATIGRRLEGGRLVTAGVNPAYWRAFN